MQGIDVVVVNYKTYSDLLQFIESYAFQKDLHNVPTMLTIVDVEGKEENFRTIMTAVPQFREDVDYKYIKTEDNIGYSGACNLAGDLSIYDILAFFNADTRLFEDTLPSCWKALEDNPDWGILGPKQVDQNGRVTHAGIFGTNTDPQHRGWRSRKPELYNDVLEAVTISGSAYFVKRSVWEELRDCAVFQELHPGERGAFLPTPLYYEETWVSYHARAHGWKVIYFGEVTMIHEWHKAIKQYGSEKVFPVSRDMFRSACKAHDIECD